MSSDPHRSENVAMGEDLLGSQRRTAASEEAVANWGSDQWWSMEWKETEPSLDDAGRR